ncbi:hypothetical protein [Geopsychrobacter electrodiphilus]|jgi:hypothetical protein|nr:hypothetical protein [Geopsychrobacter electrodiphilus]
MKTFVTVVFLVLLAGATLSLSGCGHYGHWGHGGNHSHYNGCGHRGY